MVGVLGMQACAREWAKYPCGERKGKCTLAYSSMERMGRSRHYFRRGMAGHALVDRGAVGIYVATHAPHRAAFGHGQVQRACLGNNLRLRDNSTSDVESYRWQ